VCGDVDVPGIYIRVNNPEILGFIRFSTEQTVEGNVDTQSAKDYDRNHFLAIINNFVI
jgi:hypothetical protein